MTRGVMHRVFRGPAPKPRIAFTVGCSLRDLSSVLASTFTT